MRSTKQKLRQAFSRRQKQQIVDTSRVPSAVLVPVYYKQGQYYILFTRRTELVREHKGDISFPGGAYQEEDETLADTALRECSEEIGLMAGDVEILGELDDTVTTSSNYIVSPFVAFIPSPYQFTLNAEETEEIIEIPISALSDRKSWHQKTGVIDGKTVASPVYHYQGKIIHGATAKILQQFLDIFTHITE